MIPSFQLHIRQIPCENSPPILSKSPFPSSTPFPALPNCDLGLNDETGNLRHFNTRKLQFTLRSPAFPLLYPPNQNCDFVVFKAASNICFLKLAVEIFNLQSGFNCGQDYLSIDGQRLCGSLPAGSSSKWFEYLNTKQRIRSSFKNITRQGENRHFLFYCNDCILTCLTGSSWWKGFERKARNWPQTDISKICSANLSVSGTAWMTEASHRLKHWNMTNDDRFYNTGLR